MSLRVSAALAALTVAAALASAGPASAAAYTHTDSTADVTVYDTGPDGAGPVAPAPADTDTDVASIASNLKPSGLTLKTTFEATPAEELDLTWSIKAAGDATRYFATAHVEDGTASGFLFHGTKSVVCRIAESAKGDSVTLIVPGGCLKRPASVRTGLVASSEQGKHHYRDDAQLKGRTTAQPALGPVITSG